VWFVLLQVIEKTLGSSTLSVQIHSIGDRLPHPCVPAIKVSVLAKHLSLAQLLFFRFA
jgi:hypothetical protein